MDKRLSFIDPVDNLEIPFLVRDQIPGVFQQVLLKDNYVKRGDYSVTELLDAPRCQALKHLHPEVDKDPNNLIHAMLGVAVHKHFETELAKLNEACISLNMETELPLEITVGNKQVSGTIDHVQWSDTMIFLSDIKNWNVFKYMSQEWSDLYWQLQFYYYMLTKTRPKLFKDRRVFLRGFVMFKDWNRKDAAIRKDAYPSRNAIQTIFQPADLKAIEQRLNYRLTLHMALEGINEPDWPDADPEDCWSRLEGWKIYKQGSTRAISGGVFNVRDYPTEKHAHGQAQLFFNETRTKKPDEAFELKEIWTSRRRCEDYCPVSSFCSTWIKYCVEQEKGNKAL